MSFKIEAQKGPNVISIKDMKVGYWYVDNKKTFYYKNGSDLCYGRIVSISDGCIGIHRLDNIDSNLKVRKLVPGDTIIIKVIR